MNARMFILATGAAAALVAPAAHAAGSSGSTGSNAAAIHALMVRGDALNRRYHLGAYRCASARVGKSPTTIKANKCRRRLRPAVPTSAPTTAGTGALACSPGTDPTMRSPDQGWVVVSDDLGVPWLYPVGEHPSSNTSECTQAQAPPTADASPQQPAGAPTSPVIQLVYPGWVIVVDETGVPWLYPVGQAGG